MTDDPYLGGPRPWWAVPLPPPPPPVPRRRYVDTCALDAGERARLWRGIQRANPALARLLREDREYQALRTTFAARLLLEHGDYQRYLAADAGSEP